MKSLKYNYPEPLDLSQQALFNLICLVTFAFFVLMFIGLTFKGGISFALYRFASIFLSQETIGFWESLFI